jgi:hypothetical protein
MADVRVFVDDAVLGRLPDVCAKSGAPADGWLTVTETVGRSGGIATPWLLLLLILGPLGWLALLVIALAGSRLRSEQLTVQVPWTEVADARLRAARRTLHLLVGLTALAVTGLFVVGLNTAGIDEAPGGAPALAVTLLAAAAAGVIGAGIASWRVGQVTVGVDLDASRRWVTLIGVHPRFVAEVRARQQQDRPADRPTP